MVPRANLSLFSAGFCCPFSIEGKALLPPTCHSQLCSPMTSELQLFKSDSGYYFPSLPAYCYQPFEQFELFAIFDQDKPAPRCYATWKDSEDIRLCWIASSGRMTPSTSSKHFHPISASTLNAQMMPPSKPKLMCLAKTMSAPCREPWGLGATLLQSPSQKVSQTELPCWPISMKC